MIVASAAFPRSGGRSENLRALLARLALAALLLAFLAVSGIRPARAQSAATDDLRLGPILIMTAAPTLLDLGAGVYDVIGNAHRNETGAADAELRLGQRLYGIGPAVGTIVDLRGGGMVYVGLDSDLAVGPLI